MTEQQKEFLSAIESGDAEVAKVLLAYSPNLIDTPTEIGVSVILLSAYYGYTDLASQLASQKSNLDIFEAAATNQQKRLERILEASPEVLHTFAVDGFTPLGLATFFGHEGLVHYLLAQGAKPNQRAKNKMQATALHSAAARKRTKIAEVLLEAGAEVNLQQSSGVTALHSAAQNGNVELVQLLLDHQANKSLATEEGKRAVDLAAEAGFGEIVNLLEQ